MKRKYVVVTLIACLILSNVAFTAPFQNYDWDRFVGNETDASSGSSINRESRGRRKRSSSSIPSFGNRNFRNWNFNSKDFIRDAKEKWDKFVEEHPNYLASPSEALSQWTSRSFDAMRKYSELYNAIDEYANSNKSEESAKKVMEIVDEIADSKIQEKCAN